MLKKQKNRKTQSPRKENMPKSKELFNAIRSFAFSPTFNVIALVLLLLSVFGGLRLLNAHNTQAQIKFVERLRIDETTNDDGENRNLPAPEIFKGEVYDTSIRLRETGALGMAISLAVFAKGAEQGSVPTSLEKIWSFISERNLMPPGLQFRDGELESPTSKFIVRFQAEPFRFEILARPVAAKTSPSILLRFPLASLDGRTITYFQSASVNNFDMPAPFAPLEKIAASGWTLEQWRGELLPKNENPLNLLEEEKRLLKENRANR